MKKALTISLAAGAFDGSTTRLDLRDPAIGSLFEGAFGAFVVGGEYGRGVRSHWMRVPRSLGARHVLRQRARGIERARTRARHEQEGEGQQRGC